MFHRKIEFTVLDSIGEFIFCPRKIHVAYVVEDEQLLLSKVMKRKKFFAEDFSESISFTGVLLLGAERIQGVSVVLFCPPSAKYRIVRQVRFDEGRLIEDQDCSLEVEEMRSQFKVDPEEFMRALRKASIEYLRRKGQSKRGGESWDGLGTA